MDYCFYCMNKKREGTSFCGYCGKKGLEKENEPYQLPAGTMLCSRYLIGRASSKIDQTKISYIARDLAGDRIVVVREYFPMGYVKRNAAADANVYALNDSAASYFENGKRGFNFGFERILDSFEDNNTVYVVSEYDKNDFEGIGAPAGQAPAAFTPPPAVPVNAPGQVPQNDNQPNNSKKTLIIIIAIIAAVLIAAGVTIALILINNNGGGSSSDSTASSSQASEESSKKQSSKKDTSKKESSEPETTVEPTTESPFVENDDFLGESALGSEDNVTLKLWVPDQAVELAKKQAANFINHYPSKRISVDVIPMGEIDAATQTMVDPDAAADVFGFPSDQISRLYSAQILEPVNAKVADAINNRDSSSAYSAASVESSLYEHPETCANSYFLVYDKSVVSDADASTFEGVLAACKKSGRQFIMDSSNGYYSCVFAFTGGAKIEGVDSNGKQVFANYSEDEAVDTLMAFAKLIKTYKGTFVSSDSAMISSGFSSKKVGAGIDGVWNKAANMRALGNNLGVAKLPTINVGGSAKPMVGMMGYKFIGVNSHSSYPRTAAALAYYLSGETCQRERAENLGWGPSNNNAISEFSSDPFISVLVEESTYFVPQVNVVGTFWNGMGTLGSEINKDYWNPDNRANTQKLFRKAIELILDN